MQVPQRTNSGAEMKKYDEDLQVEFKNYSQLSFLDTGNNFVQVFVDDVLTGCCMVFIDSENERREYVIINYEIIYLDTIKTKK